MSDYTGSGVYFITSRATSTVLDLTNSNKADGTKLIGWKKSTSKINQQWQICHVGNEEYLLLSVATGTYVTAPESGTLNITGNLISPISKSARWRITPTPGTGAYVITSVAHPDKAIDLAGSNGNNGTAIILFNAHKKENQQWFLTLS